MSNCIPKFHGIFKQLNEILENASAKAGMWKISAQTFIALFTLSYGPEHVTALASLQDSLRTAVKLAFSKQDRVICMYTDAPEAIWASVVMQTNEDDLGEVIEQQ